MEKVTVEDSIGECSSISLHQVGKANVFTLSHRKTGKNNCLMQILYSNIYICINTYSHTHLILNLLKTSQLNYNKNDIGMIMMKILKKEKNIAVTSVVDLSLQRTEIL